MKTVHRKKGGVVVRRVVPQSAADQCGIERGDKILNINGVVIPDSLSFEFNVAYPELEIQLEKGDGDQWQIEVSHDPGTSFGLELEEDPIVLCRNKCIFCFVDQNPRGYRPSLLIKDEDVRLSFLYGNYSTLSSTDTAEEERIIRERISPLYVSVHATDPETRIFMLKNKKMGDILQRLERFARGGIDFHTQIVLCPGINDGAILRRSIEDLVSLHPRMLSIAVVPLGITAHRQKLTELKVVTPDYCRQVLDAVAPYQQRFNDELGHTGIYMADEFYLRAGRQVPERDDYSDFPQLENGVGMVRRFIDAFRDGIDDLSLKPGLKATIVTGALFGPILSDLVEHINRRLGTELHVAPIANHAFGADLIGVAGLVHGSDMLDQLSGLDLGRFVMIPRVMLRESGDPILIDNYHPGDLALRLGCPVVLCHNEGADFLSCLQQWQQHVAPDPPAEREYLPISGPVSI